MLLQLMDSLLQLAMSGQQTSAMMRQLALYAVKLIVARASSVDKEHFIRVSFVHVLHSNCGPFVSCGVLVSIFGKTLAMKHLLLQSRVVNLLQHKIVLALVLFSFFLNTSSHAVCTPQINFPGTVFMECFSILVQVVEVLVCMVEGEEESLHPLVHSNALLCISGACQRLVVWAIPLLPTVMPRLLCLLGAVEPRSD